MPATSALALVALLAGPMPLAASPEGRAIAFLSREVPKWSAENKCYSCHNNGDAARALYQAKRLGWPLDKQALADTTLWLAKPAGWDKNDGDGAPKDKRLALLQFAASLAEAKEAGQIREREPLDKAAALVAELQDKGGSWPIDTSGLVGHPATHGTALATYLARRTLQRLDERKYAKALAGADAWARSVKVDNTLDAAALLLLLDRATDDAANAQRQRCLELIRKGESKTGGWGPAVGSGPEVFDSAVVVLALARQQLSDETRAMLKRGRAYLIAEQQDDGSWIETTRPSGGVSYAERLSTSGWALQALLAK